jgi:lysophospholipase L1-like esterase
VALFNQYPLDVGNVVFDNAAVDVATITTLSDTKCVVIFTNATTTSDDNLVVTEGVKRYNSVDERLLKIESVSIPIFTGVSDINASFFSKNIKAIKDVTMWGLAADETLSLQANWNAAVSGDGSTTSALGFLSSAGYAVAPSLPNTAPTSIYPRWTVTESIVGLKTYLLYKNADSSNPALGSVTIDWDDLEGASLFNDKTSKLKLDSDAINSVQLSYFDSKVVNPDAPVVDPNNPYFGKKIGAIGDSITWGYRPQNDPDGAAGTQLNSWLALTALELGMTATNAGISGSTLAALDATDNRQPMCRRYTSLPDDLDVICVMGGTNDVRLNIPLGVMTNRTDATYYGALHIICEGLIAKYYVNQGTAIGKTKQIVMLTPTKMLASNGALYPLLAPYALAAKEVAEYYSIPCLDLYNKSNITPHTSQTLQGTATGFLNMYNPYITDGIHPTQAGHFMMTKAVVGFLNTL